MVRTFPSPSPTSSHNYTLHSNQPHPLAHLTTQLRKRTELTTRAEENGKPLNHIRASFASQTDAFAVLLRLAELEFKCNGDRLFVEYAAESEVGKLAPATATAHEFNETAQEVQGTAVHVSEFRGSIEELEVAFGGMDGYKGVLVGESRPLTSTDTSSIFG